MVTESMLELLFTVIEWALGLFVFEPGTFIADGAGYIGQALGNGAGLGAWVPWAVVLTAVGLTVSLWLVGFLIKGIRWLVGWFPTMGSG